MAGRTAGPWSVAFLAFLLLLIFDFFFLSSAASRRRRGISRRRIARLQLFVRDTVVALQSQYSVSIDGQEEYIGRNKEMDD